MLIVPKLANAEVDYVNARTGEVLATLPFYDPGLDEGSKLARDEKAAGRWRGPRLAYGCGRALR